MPTMHRTLSVKDTAGNRTNKTPQPHGAYLLVGKENITQNNEEPLFIMLEGEIG